MYYSSHLFDAIIIIRIWKNFSFWLTGEKHDRSVLHYSAIYAIDRRCIAKFALNVVRRSSYRLRGKRDVIKDHATSPPIATRRSIGPHSQAGCLYRESATASCICVPAVLASLYTRVQTGTTCSATWCNEVVWC